MVVFGKELGGRQLFLGGESPDASAHILVEAFGGGFGQSFAQRLCQELAIGVVGRIFHDACIHGGGKDAKGRGTGQGIVGIVGATWQRQAKHHLFREVARGNEIRQTQERCRFSVRRALGPLLPQQGQAAIAALTPYYNIVSLAVGWEDAQAGVRLVFCGQFLQELSRISQQAQHLFGLPAFCRWPLREPRGPTGWTVVHIGGRCHAGGQPPGGEEVRPVDVGRKGREGIVVSIQCRKNRQGGRVSVRR